MNNDVPRNEELNAPLRLVEALRQAASDQIFIPPAIDRTILTAAQRQFGTAGKADPYPTRIRWWMRLATALALVVTLALVTIQWQRSANLQFAREDVNRDGQIDILDAFALARQVKQGSLRDKK